MGDPSEGGELTPTSGEGQCEMRVCDTDGEPRCHVDEPTGHVCLARLRTVTRPQPLSMESLQGVRDGLERCRELGEELGSCLDLALERFCREPQYVQENARLLIPWGGGELEFVSGKGECEITVCYGNGRPQYHDVKIPVHMYLERLHASPEPLSTNTLRRVLNELGSCHGDTHALRACFLCAWQRFCQEPLCVQENARLLIHWDGQELEFVSGQGQCEISVSCTTGEPQYHITEKTWDVFVAWMNSHPEPLSIKNLERVRNRLESWGALGQELSSCFVEAISQFSLEPQCVQENARLLIQWGRRQLTFTSGKGECEITVHYRAGGPQYNAVKVPVLAYLARLRAHQQLLSADTLQRLLRELGSCHGDTGALRACFDRAWQGFRQEPRCVQENARLLIRWGGEELEFVSSQGQCEISVLLADGEPQYHITELGGDRPVTWSHSSPEPLSVTDLARVRDRLGHWGALGEELSGCFGEAISQFSREPPSVQENARLLIQWGQGELEFVSGQGQCEISVLLADGEPQYHITELGGDRPVTWSHASPEPLSVEDLERVWDRLGHSGVLGEELSSCFGEAISQFSREPPWVQENARLRLCWDTGSLEFLSGQGQYMFTVSYQDGNPRYHFHVETLPVHLYVTRLRSHKDPLSADSLIKFHTELGLCRGDTAVLRACLYRAWEGFSREPLCVQENARLLIRWGEEELAFVSGQGRCEISVLLADGEPQYHITELGGDRPVTWSHSSPEPLSVADLVRVRDRLMHWGALGEGLSSCFGEAISQFSREPPCVQENARMGIWWDRGNLQFLSGNGKCEISVHYRDGRPHYAIGEFPEDMYLDRLHTCPEPLSADTLCKVREKLESFKGERDDLRACFHRAWDGFHQEPPSVQDNARLLIRCGKRQLQFTSGNGECEISVRCGDGEPQYHVRKIPVLVYLAQLRTHAQSLSTDTLQRVLRELGSCHGDTGTLRACFDRAWQGFRREPRCVQENARLLIRWGGGELEFISGRGENLITVCEGEEGRIQYRVQVSGWWPRIARLLIFWKVLGRD